MSKHYLILGVSAASLGVLNKLRALAPESTITCLAAQKELPFNLCLIADVLAGVKTPTQAQTKNLDFFKENNIALHLGEKIITLDRSKKTVTTERGNLYPYDILFIGTGTTPWIPKPFDTLQAENLFSFQSLATAQKIIEYCIQNGVKRATIIGAGLTGIECADALNQRGINVTLIERGPHILPHALTPEGASLLESLITNKKVAVRTNTSVDHATCTERKITHLKMNSGELLTTDLVVCAVGAHPNSEFAREAHLEMHETQRILVDLTLRTSDPAIFAAGDVVAVPHILTKKPTPSAAWPDAMIQGMHAAHTMVGIEKPYAGLMPLISSRFFETGFVSAGTLIKEPTDSVHIEHGDEYYHFFLTNADNLLKGFMLVGKLDHIGKYRSALIKQEEFIL